MSFCLFFIVFLSLTARFCSAEATANSATTGTLLVISAVESVESDLSELLDFRRNQGWTVKIHHTQSTSPRRIAATVAYEKENNPGLSHVLLVGSDVSLPMARRQSYRVQLNEPDLPLLTDDLYGLPDGSGISKLAVGRLPTDSSPVLRKLAAKIVRYEKEIKTLRHEIFLLTGREPADTTPLFAGISTQDMVDNVSKVFIGDAKRRLPRLKLRVRTAFPGPYHYTFNEGPEVLQNGLSRRPIFVAYIGHADRDCFATYHDASLVSSIYLVHVRSFDLSEVCGPLISGGCSMLEPGKISSLGEELLFLEGGPVGVVGFTRVNDDFYVMQLLEIFIDELNNSRTVTVGELISNIKSRLIQEPQRLSSQMVQSFMQREGTISSDSSQVDYPKVVRKNNALLTLFGDPTTTIVIP